MMKLLPGFPDNVVGVVASGEVDADDYKTVLVPAIESALRKHDRIRMLYHLGPDFTSFSAGAMWDDARVGLSHLKAWEQVAVVTDVPWVAHAARMFRFLMPGVVRVFSLKEHGDAAKWIAT
jgi:hypothetical protein